MSRNELRYRRRFQFSLRSFFLAVTAFAIWFGPRAENARRQRVARQALEKIGDNIIYEHQLPRRGNGAIDYRAIPPGPTWLRRWLGQDFFDRIVDARIDYSSGTLGETDTALAGLRRLPYLRSLALGGSLDLTDDSLMRLASLTKLRSLSLTHVRVTPDGLAHLEQLKALETLMIQDAPLVDAIPPVLRGLVNLKNLQLNGTRIGDHDLIGLESLEQLEELGLSGTRISDLALMHLRVLKRLKRLDVSATRATAAGVADFQRALPECQVVVDTTNALKISSKIRRPTRRPRPAGRPPKLVEVDEKPANHEVEP